MTEQAKSKKTFAACSIMFAAYIVITFVGALFHEVWFDEAQFWVIARDIQLDELINQMAHEGHSALWALILMPFAKAGLPVLALGIISWAIMCSAEWVLLFRSPFSLPLKAAVTFSAGMLYINVTVSRVYALIPLILFLLALLYKQREKYAVLYGLLIGLLANTHIMMCGVVAVLGIMMFIDTLRDFKTRGAKGNVKQLAGLFLGGLLVLALLMQIFPSMSSNNFTSTNEYTVTTLVNGFLTGFTGVSASLFGEMQLFNNMHIVTALLNIFFMAAIIAVGFLVRKNVRILIIYITSLLSEIIVTCAIWYINPNRAALILLTVVFCSWLFFSDKENRSEKRILPEGISIIDALMSLDKKAEKVITLCLSVVLFMTVPLGVFFIASDIVRPFSPSKETAEFISENIPENTTIVTMNDSNAVDVSAYLTDYSFYDVNSRRSYTYCYHDKLSSEKTDGVIDTKLSNNGELYILIKATDISTDYYGEPIFVSSESIPFYNSTYYFKIYKYADRTVHE